MSIAGVAASSLFSGAIAQSTQAKLNKAQQEFQQLGHDLQAGNLAQAQADLSGLQKDIPAFQLNRTSSSGNSSATFSQSLQKLAQDLQSGNLTGAQSDFQALQSSAQSGATRIARHHHHPGSGAATDATSTGSPTSTIQLFSQLGQELQSGSLSSAQASYAALLQDFQQYGSGGGLGGNLEPLTGNVSLTA